MLHKICEAKPQQDFRLRLIYSDGATVEVDFTPVLRQGGVFTPLSDPAFCAQVAVDELGRFIYWPGGLDFCADALWEQRYAQTNVR